MKKILLILISLLMIPCFVSAEDKIPQEVLSAYQKDSHSVLPHAKGIFMGYDRAKIRKQLWGDCWGEGYGSVCEVLADRRKHFNCKMGYIPNTPIKEGEPLKRKKCHWEIRMVPLTGSLGSVIEDDKLPSR